MKKKIENFYKRFHWLRRDIAAGRFEITFTVNRERVKIKVEKKATSQFYTVTKDVERVTGDKHYSAPLELSGALGYVYRTYYESDLLASREPTPGEIAAGYGVTHYRTFRVSDALKTDGVTFKKRFKADDGLFYKPVR